VLKINIALVSGSVLRDCAESVWKNVTECDSDEQVWQARRR